MGPDVRYGLLHGRLSAEEKAAALDAFASGETNVLIATTVVEASPCTKHPTYRLLHNGATPFWSANPGLPVAAFCTETNL